MTTCRMMCKKAVSLEKKASAFDKLAVTVSVQVGGWLRNDEPD